MQLTPQTGNLYILSAYRAKDDSNEEYHRALMRAVRLQDIQHSEVEGSYNGVTEKSVILFGSHKIVAHHYASLNKQECFLKLTPHRDGIYKAYFIDTVTGDERFAGYWRSFAPKVIEDLKLDYTKDNAGTYFTIWPTDTLDMLDLGCEISNELIRKMEKLG